MNAAEHDSIARIHERLDQIIAERAARGEVLARIETRVVGLDVTTAEVKGICKEHNGDIRALQRWQAKLTGAFGVLTFGVIFIQPLAIYVLIRQFG